MEKYHDVLRTLSGGEAVEKNTTFREFRRGNSLGFCQPKALSDVWRNPFLVRTALQKREILIGVKENLSDEELPGLLAHEIEHGFEYAQASVKDLLTYGAVYAAYETVENDSAWGKNLLARIRDHERLLDMRSIQRGNGEHLFHFRRNRTHHTIPSRFDRKDQYLTDVEIMAYLWGVRDVEKDIAQAQERLGITKERIFGQFPIRYLLGQKEGIPVPQTKYDTP